jgi:hypothetical protein
MLACRAGRFRNLTGPDRGRVPRESHSHRTRATAQLGASVVDVQDVDRFAGAMRDACQCATEPPR